MVSIGDTYPIDTTVSVSVSDTVSDTVSVNRDVDINKKTASDTAKASKHKYGEYLHVLLKDEELQALQRDYANWRELIKYLDEYIEMKGYKAKSHYLCIKKWVVDAVAEKKQKGKKQENATTFSDLRKELLDDEGGDTNNPGDITDDISQVLSEYQIR